MSEVKHTPGPWFIYGEPSEKGSVDIHTDNNVWVGEALGTHVGVGSKEEAYANAKLIAAAPDMLQALRSVAKYLHYKEECNGRGLGESFPHPKFEIADAIAKATQ